MTSHSETRVLPYTAQQMYDLVADVAKYPEFLPWTAGATIRSVTDRGDHQEMLADLVISFKLFQERFGSRVRLYPERKRIETEYIQGPFKHMESVWQFRDVPHGVEVSFRTDFEFRNRLLQHAAGVFFHQAMTQIVRAFEKRAQALYGARSTA
ncbi:Putative oligoketide cyclase/dehydratase or lipid transport protein YfjG [Rubellimicrobium mesophilum DSM 19309]|uniref:Putative oligoketide cyclase/dehydratase or lipid transport protein YfjG n=1 Tax=Rubellimicrobium mesophilum DSM 19309 TaxID=442562 RepID=A0A017HIH5_9RHOB|nr:type II toxin-antitoxin system RatA family toxin [Rubellimicrobium mesophilum]EYD73559.1 Putative oligoketide cyclase/dehydratase or lipid transport protein YfjG [Rubellimicrobium mesophilum DSM 19309]